MRLLSAAAIAAATLLVYAMPAHAQQIRYVAANGNDSRSCTIEADPCQTLTRAIAVSRIGGEIRILSELPDEIATIGKSLAIDGNGHTMIGRLVVNQGPAVVVIRNLNLTGGGSATSGITVTRAAAVHIENVGIERYTQYGVFLGSITNTEVTISGSSIHDNNRGIVHTGGGAIKLSVHDTHIENNSADGVFSDGGTVLITDTVIAGQGGRGVRIPGPATLAVLGTTIASNGTHGIDLQNGASATFVSSTLRDNAGNGLLAGGAGTGATIADSLVTGAWAVVSSRRPARSFRHFASPPSIRTSSPT